MTGAPLAAAPRAGTAAQAQAPTEQAPTERALIEQARAHARRRRRKTALAVIIAAVTIGGGLAWAGALSGSGPRARGVPSRPAPLTAHNGAVTGYIDPCEGLPVRLPFAAGTVTALRGSQTWKLAGDNGTYQTYRLQLPATVAARQRVGQNQKFYLDLPPGRYVLVGRDSRGDVTTYLDVTISAGRVLHRDLPNLCK